jgi:molybdopterin-guanine dinucleotide biosynthesis protein A
VLRRSAASVIEARLRDGRLRLNDTLDVLDLVRVPFRAIPGRQDPFENLNSVDAATAAGLVSKGRIDRLIPPQ